LSWPKQEKNDLQLGYVSSWSYSIFVQQVPMFYIFK